MASGIDEVLEFAKGCSHLGYSLVIPMLVDSIVILQKEGKMRALDIVYLDFSYLHYGYC